MDNVYVSLAIPKIIKDTVHVAKSARKTNISTPKTNVFVNQAILEINSIDAKKQLDATYQINSFQGTRVSASQDTKDLASTVKRSMILIGQTALPAHLGTKTNLNVNVFTVDST